MVSDHFSGTLSELDRQVVRSVPPGGNWRDLPIDFPSERLKQIRRTAAAGQGSRSTYYGRLSWDKPSYTISTFFSRPGNGCFIHPEYDRLITVREAARLQSFPDDFQFKGAGRSRFKQIGNAVPPLLAHQMSRMFNPGSVVDLFSGCGGFSLGCRLSGFEVVASADSDRAANETYIANHNGAYAPIDLDLSDSGELRVAIKEIERQVGSGGIDLLAGGPPCQGFSTAGNCLADDPRNRLVLSFLYAVKELRPRSVLMENVSALAFRRGEVVRVELLHELSKLGYKVETIIAHSEGYGVPQLRRRFFVAASLGPIVWPAPWAALSDPGFFRFQPMSQEPAAPANTVRDAIFDLPASQATSTDESVRLESSATSLYQRWARGEISVEGIVPPFAGATLI
jgi:DNA (cytosine-5)-methyltransferase 1